MSTPTPQVWYLDRAYDWHFLAPNFGAYFRMMLVHLGLPQWQLLFTPAGPTPRAKVSLAISLPRLQLRSLYLGNICSDLLIIKYKNLIEQKTYLVSIKALQQANHCLGFRICKSS